MAPQENEREREPFNFFSLLKYFVRASKNGKRKINIFAQYQQYQLSYIRKNEGIYLNPKLIIACLTSPNNIKYVYVALNFFVAIDLPYI